LHAEHKKVIEAILAGDAVAAHAAMFHHMSLVEEPFERLAQSI
jgi:DNA-binding GntR family transcriptional regulator